MAVVISVYLFILSSILYKKKRVFGGGGGRRWMRCESREVGWDWKGGEDVSLATV